MYWLALAAVPPAATLIYSIAAVQHYVSCYGAADAQDNTP